MEEDEKKNKKKKSVKSKVIKAVVKQMAKPFIIGVIIFALVMSILSAAVWFLKKKDTKEDEKDPKNASSAVRKFMNDSNIDENGNITSGKSIKELWEEMLATGNRATAYLNSAEELAKLIYAARALDYPDTRKNPDTPINWDKLDIDSNKIQGIVKFKRALYNGKTITMTYVSPSKFQELMSKYKTSGTEKDRNEALKYFTVEKTASASNSSVEGKVSSLNGMVFMGDSILTRFHNYKGEELKQEGATLFYRSGCTARYFLGTEVVTDCVSSGCKETSDGHFDWNANFQNITNPTGFYLMLGQNYMFKDDRIQQTDELIKKIRSQYPYPPIYISSVLHYIDSDGAAQRAATRMNEELKKYCEANKSNNVYYSDILRGYNDNLRELTEDDNDHPNARGVEVLLKNIKENIIGGSTSIAKEILQYACSWVGKVGYKTTKNDPNGERFKDLHNGGYSDCSHFVHKVFGHFGLMDNSDSGFVKSEKWGEGAPGTEKKGTDISNASPGDVIWEHYGTGSDNHVSIYLGNGKRVECAAGAGGVVISDVPSKIDQILHFTKIPVDTSAYFDPTTGAYNSSTSGNGTGTDSGSANYGSVTGATIVDEAEKYVGKLPYVWKGSSLETGADCSGFCWAILHKLGLYEGERISTIGFETAGKEVASLAEAQAGDMLIFGPSKGNSKHMGIFDGNGGMIHEPQTGKKATHKSSIGRNDLLTIRRFTDKAGTSGITASTPEEIAKMPRNYNNDTLNVDKVIDAHKRMAHPHHETLREFRASQAACYDGKYIIHFQNKNFGHWTNSNYGGRICWSNVETGEMDYVIETEEGGHGDGIAYDSERNVVLKCVDGSNNLLEIDNNTKTITRTHKNARI